MAKRVIWSEDAFHDKVQLFSYWNHRNKSNLYSRKLNKLFKETIKSILRNSTIGRNTNLVLCQKVLLDCFLRFRIAEQAQ